MIESTFEIGDDSYIGTKTRQYPITGGAARQATDVFNKLFLRKHDQDDINANEAEKHELMNKESGKRDKIQMKKRDYDIKRFNDQMTTSDRFIHELTQRVNLKNLYTIVGVCNFNVNARWCPVLLRIGEHLKKTETDCSMLLQVWDTQGRCVFEKPLADGSRIVNWFILD